MTIKTISIFLILLFILYSCALQKTETVLWMTCSIEITKNYNMVQEVKRLMKKNKENTNIYIKDVNKKLFSSSSQVIMDNWKQSKEYANITSLVFSPSWEEYAYIWLLTDTHKSVIVKNWKTSRDFEGAILNAEYINNKDTFKFLVNKIELDLGEYEIYNCKTWVELHEVSSISDKNNLLSPQDAERMSNLSILQWAINIKTTMWTPLESFVVRDEKYEWKDIYVWWRKLKWWVDYFVWTPNYITFGGKKENFLDPDGSEYIIWITTAKWWKDEILSFFHNINGEKIATIVWTYYAWNEISWKEWIDYTITWDYTIKINNSHIWKINKWDIIDGNEVIKITSDWLNIIFRKIFNKWLISIIQDSKWLIYINGYPVENNEIIKQ